MTFEAPPPLWAHQRGAIDWCHDHPGALLDCKMGTGKSRMNVTLWDEREAKLVLVGSPLSVVPVWPTQLGKFGNPDRGWRVLELGEDAGTVKHKAAALRDAVARCTASGRPLLVCLNYDSMWRPGLAKLLMSIPWDVASYDEVHRIKSYEGRASRFCADLYRSTQRRVGGTGTPMPHSPLDVFGEARALQPDLFGSSWTKFRATYATIDNRAGFPKITGYKNLDQLAAKMATITYRVESNVLSLPPATHSEVVVTLTPKTRRIYESLKTDLVAAIADGIVTVDNALVQLLRLQQVTGGFVSVDPDPLDALGASTLSELGDEKERALEDVLDGLAVDEPVVVFARFRHDLDVIHRVAKKLNRGSLELSGRRRELKEWQSGHSYNPAYPKSTRHNVPPILATQIQAGGVGIDLTRAAYCGFFSLGFSLGDYEQALARVRRPGQESHVHYFHLIAKDTVDESVYGAIRNKANIVRTVCDDISRRQRVA